MALARPGHQNLFVIGVVTDSAAGLPSEAAARLGVEVVPLHLSVGGRSLRDGELPDLYERLEREPGSVTTSTPSPGDFEEAFARRLEEEVVCVTLAASVSGVHGAASLAAAMSPKRVEVVDSGSASMGEGWVALAAARAAAAGAPFEEVVAALHARAEEDARDLLDRVRGRVEIVEEHLVEFTAVMGAHTGPGVVGLAYHPEAQA